MAPARPGLDDRRETAAESPAPTRLSVTMLGALPPWRGVAPYTQKLLEGLETVDDVQIEFIDFISLYPPRLYPGGDPLNRSADRPTFRRARIRRLLAWYNPISWLWAGITLRGAVVHAQWWSYVLAPVYLTVLAIARLRGRKVVLTLHNVSPHEGFAWQRWLYRCVFRLAHHFIVHSQRNAETLLRAYPPSASRIAVVDLGLHTASVTRDISRREARHELGLAPDGPVILFFGNIRPYKGLDVLLQAFRRVLDQGQQATLVIAGQPWGDFAPYRRLIEQSALHGHIRAWLEYLPEERVEAFFAAADLAVFPYTHFDSQSAAATLALSFGMPILVSDVGALPELVDDPRAVVPANDPVALADGIRAILTDSVLSEKLATDARRVASQLDWGTIAQKTVVLYHALASAPMDSLFESEATEGVSPEEKR